MQFTLSLYELVLALCASAALAVAGVYAAAIGRSLARCAAACVAVMVAAGRGIMRGVDAAGVALVTVLFTIALGIAWPFKRLAAMARCPNRVEVVRQDAVAWHSAVEDEVQSARIALEDQVAKLTAELAAANARIDAMQKPVVDTSNERLTPSIDARLDFMADRCELAVTTANTALVATQGSTMPGETRRADVDRAKRMEAHKPVANDAAVATVNMTDLRRVCKEQCVVQLHTIDGRLEAHSANGRFAVGAARGELHVEVHDDALKRMLGSAHGDIPIYRKNERGIRLGDRLVLVSGAPVDAIGIAAKGASIREAHNGWVRAHDELYKPALRFAANKDVRSFLNGINVEVDDGKVRYTASDGHRMVISDWRRYGEMPCGIIPREVAKAASVKGGELWLSAKGCAAVTPDAVVEAEWVEGKFPDVERLVPSSVEFKGYVKADGLLKAVRKRVTDIKREQPHWRQTGDFKRVIDVAIDIGGEAGLQAAVVTGDDVMPDAAAYNETYIADMCRAFKGDELRYSVTPDRGMGVFEAHRHKVYVMPRRRTPA